MAAATDQQEFRFNKLGNIGKAAGFLLVGTGFMIRSIVRDYEGDLSLGNLISEVTPLGAVLFVLLFAGLAFVLIRALLKPENRVSLSTDQLTFHGKGKPQLVQYNSVLAVAVLERKRRTLSPRRVPPFRFVVVVSNSGTNLGPIPEGGRWVSQNAPDTGFDRRDLVEELLADKGVLSELPNDEFGNSMRQKLTGTTAQRIKKLQSAHPDLGAIVIPLHGMPRETEAELRDAVPNWI